MTFVGHGAGTFVADLSGIAGFSAGTAVVCIRSFGIDFAAIGEISVGITIVVCTCGTAGQVEFGQIEARFAAPGLSFFTIAFADACLAGSAGFTDFAAGTAVVVIGVHGVDFAAIGEVCVGITIIVCTCIAVFQVQVVEKEAVSVTVSGFVDAARQTLTIDAFFVLGAVGTGWSFLPPGSLVFWRRVFLGLVVVGFGIIR